MEIKAQHDCGVYIKDIAAMMPGPLEEQKGMKEDDQVIQFLLDRGALATSINKSLDTPLHAAAAEGHISYVDDLLRHGADLNARNDKGWTPLDQSINISGDDGQMSVYLKSLGAQE